MHVNYRRCLDESAGRATLGQMNILSELVVVVFQTATACSFIDAGARSGRKAKYQQSGERAADTRWEAGWLAAAAGR